MTSVAAAAAGHAQEAARQTTKLIIDTDPGIDDALAICLALGFDGVEVLALTTVFGNSPDVRVMSHNAQKVLNIADHGHIPIHEGAATPLITTGNHTTYVQDTLKAQSVMIHGHDGLGGVSPPLPGEWTPNEMTAAECIVQRVKQHPNEVVLVMLGPLTNLALAIMLFPGITALVRQVVVMGGALSSPRGHEHNTPDSNRGNVTSSAEANIFKDPHAAHKVVHAGFGPEKLVFVTLDLTTQTNYESSALSSVFSDETQTGALGQFIRKAHEHYVDVYKNGFGRKCVPFHDSCAVFYAVSASSFETVDVTMHIETKGELTFGMTFLDGRGAGGGSAERNVRICKSIAVDDLYAGIRSSVTKLGSRRLVKT